MKRYGRPRAIVTDRLRSYGTAMKMIGNAAAQECGRWLNNRAENSHQPFRRREGAMVKFRDIKTLQKFASVHASLYNHFNQNRHLNRRDIFKKNRAGRVASAGGLNASDRHPLYAGSGLSDKASSVYVTTPLILLKFVGSFVSWIFSYSSLIPQPQAWRLRGQSNPRNSSSHPRGGNFSSRARK